MTTCPDLRTLYGRRYRMTYEPSCDPWYAIIPCRYGHIGAWGENLLVASVATGHVKLAGTLRRMPECTVVQDGDDGEVNATFHVSDFAKVARVMKPKRRYLGRPMTEAEKQKLIAAGAKYRFVAGRNGQDSDEKRAQTPSGDPKHPGRQMRPDFVARSASTAATVVFEHGAGEAPKTNGIPILE